MSNKKKLWTEVNRTTSSFNELEKTKIELAKTKDKLAEVNDKIHRIRIIANNFNEQGWFCRKRSVAENIYKILYVQDDKPSEA